MLLLCCVNVVGLSCLSGVVVLLWVGRLSLFRCSVAGIVVIVVAVVCVCVIVVVSLCCCVVVSFSG